MTGLHIKLHQFVLCVEDLCMYLLYYGVVLYHEYQLHVSYSRYTDLLGPKSCILFYFFNFFQHKIHDFFYYNLRGKLH